MAALDFLSAPFSIDTRPKKRARLRWDDLGRSYCEESGHQQQCAPQFLFPTQPIVQDAQCLGAADLSFRRDYRFVSGQVHGLPAESVQWHKDDEDGHFNFKPGESLTPRYRILQQIGEGTFGRVLECWDRDAQELVAIKVVRSAEKYREAARIEVNLLCMLAEKDQGGLGGCVQIRNWFDYQNHICIVCEKLGPSLYDFLRTNNYCPFSIDLVQEFGRQILESVACVWPGLALWHILACCRQLLHFMHGLNLIHTDLKPENVLLVSSDYTMIVDYKNSREHPVQMKRVPISSRIKLIDFGSATYDKEDSFSIVSTRHYRAPEVILGLGWSFPCDIWSVGCILVELCSGEALFQTHENLEHLAMMERVLGSIPSHIIKKSLPRAGKYFQNGQELNWPNGATSRESVRVVRKLPRLRNLVMQHADHSAGMLIDLLEQLLQYNPSERPTAKDALKHPFFKRYSRG